jgi:hypothetical protein
MIAQLCGPCRPSPAPLQSHAHRDKGCDSVIHTMDNICRNKNLHKKIKKRDGQQMEIVLRYVTSSQFIHSSTVVAHQFYFTLLSYPFQWPCFTMECTWNLIWLGNFTNTFKEIHIWLPSLKVLLLNSCFTHYCIFPSQPNLSFSHNRPHTRYYPICPRLSINVCCVTTVTTQYDTMMVVGASRLKPLSQPFASIFRGILSDEES